MSEPAMIVDDAIKDELLRYPTMELLKLLFPSLVVKGRSVVKSPFRKDTNPSFSCFRDRNGYQRWKDHGEDTTGDNIDLYRKVYPELNYADACDGLSRLIFGKSALRDPVPGRDFVFRAGTRRTRPVKPAVEDESQKLVILEDRPYDVRMCPSFLRDYVRGRGISDEVASRYLRYVVYENENIKGRPVIDRTSGLPVYGPDGQVERKDGRLEAVALANDIGGFALRAPQTEDSPVVKHTNMSFVTTILASGEPNAGVRFQGEGDNFVCGLMYYKAERMLRINRYQGFAGIEPWAIDPCFAFLEGWVGRYLDGRELKNVTAVLRSLNSRMTSEVDVVEGMFDAVSVIEFERMAGREPRPARDILVLNSTGNIQWAVPFLAAHRRVHSLLDNDMKSAAGQKAFENIRSRMAEFADKIRFRCEVVSDSAIFYPCKDMNDFLKARKGLAEGAADAPVAKKKRSQGLGPGSLPSSGKKQIKP